MTFAENLKSLQPVGGIDRIELLDAQGHRIAVIENKPGQQGSLAVYHHLLRKFGNITASAAKEGLLLYAEHTQDARNHPGKHPNIDRLLSVENGNGDLAGSIFPPTASG